MQYWAMIAYVFWHRPRADVSSPRYEEACAGFHRGLARRAPNGFLGSGMYRLGGASWLPAGSDGYEDWYLVEGMSNLEPLNDGAVADSLRLAHDDAARFAAWGSAGIYRARGEARMESIDATTALWFAKPTKLAYDALYRTLDQRGADTDGRLWQRVMTLGPTPEFCLFGRGAEVLPFQCPGELVVRRPVLPMETVRA